MVDREEEEKDGLRPARGLVLGLVIGALMWGVILMVVWLWLWPNS
ncbi:hypothetical protein N6H14_03420 [Paenibacillus sp. CC-CFT747]|nr:hypothetical protein N6H14_03420 [Paenibacillus sp. CC-CFT747]